MFRSGGITLPTVSALDRLSPRGGTAAANGVSIESASAPQPGRTGVATARQEPNGHDRPEGGGGSPRCSCPPSALSGLTVALYRTRRASKSWPVGRPLQRGEMAITKSVPSLPLAVVSLAARGVERLGALDDTSGTGGILAGAGAARTRSNSFGNAEGPEGPPSVPADVTPPGCRRRR